MISNEIIKQINQIEQNMIKECLVLSNECKLILDKQQLIKADAHKQMCMLIDEDIFEKVYELLEEEYPDFEPLYRERISSNGIELSIKMNENYDSRTWFNLSFEAINEYVHSKSI